MIKKTLLLLSLFLISVLFFAVFNKDSANYNGNMGFYPSLDVKEKENERFYLEEVEEENEDDDEEKEEVEKKVGSTVLKLKKPPFIK